jgi:hypothetical protein
MGTAWANHGRDPRSQSNQAPSKGCLTSHYLGAEDGIRTRDPHLGNVRTTVHPVHHLRIRALQSTFCPPNTPQSTQFA